VASAARLVAPRTFRLERATLAALGEHEVAVAVGGCGICGSNTPVGEGRPWFSYPLAPGQPGHEAWGLVDDIGAGVDGWRIGQPVALTHEAAFAERLHVHPDQLVALPPALDGVAFPGEAFGCCFNAARRAGFRPGQVVAVVGVGFIGAVLVRLAAHAGATVVAINRSAAPLELAARLGARHLVELGDVRQVQHAVDELTGEARCGVVVEAAGVQPTLDVAGAIVGVGGRLVIAGYHQDGTRTVDLQEWNWRGIDVVNAHERDRAVIRRGIADAAAAVEQGWLDPRCFVTHELAFAEIDAAMDLAAQRRRGLVKAVVTMGAP
jgi:threonine dehydrogenase-like Zn-dependent dehydrogenase